MKTFVLEFIHEYKLVTQVLLPTNDISGIFTRKIECKLKYLISLLPAPDVGSNPHSTTENLSSESSL